MYMKNSLHSDWLKAVQLKCNTSAKCTTAAKSVTPVQLNIVIVDWFAAIF